MNECGQTLLGIGHLVHPSSGAAGERSRPGVSPFISALTVSCRPATFPGVWPHIWSRCPELWDFLSHRPGAEDEGRGFHNTPCLLLKSALCFRLTSPKQSPAFLPRQMPLPSPGGNGIFRATPTERITHYTLLRKVVLPNGALPPLKPPATNRCYAPSREHSAVCCQQPVSRSACSSL